MEREKFSADDVLRLFLNAPSEESSSEFFDLLMQNFALPVINKILRAKIKNWQTSSELNLVIYEDLQNECCLKIVGLLRSRKNNPNAPPIEDFSAYCAKIVYNVWNSFVRDHSPKRESLKNKIRYALGKDAEFDIWQEKDEICCGLTAIERRFREFSAEELIVRVEDEVENFRSGGLETLLFEILVRADSAIRLNELVSIAARLWAVEDLAEASLEDFRADGNLARQNQENEFEMHFTLSQIWREICELPVNQRIALLYNLRDERGREMLVMFFNFKIATLREIAQAMNLSVEECAEILPQMPMEDKTIAERMNLTAKQVANLRKVARENLRRRLAGKAKRKKIIHR